MFLKLHQSEETRNLFPNSLNNASTFINHAKKYLSKKEQDKAGFLCGNGGVYAVSCIINHQQKDETKAKEDLKNFLEGVAVTKKIDYNKYGSDEILFGRAGFLSAIYWINQNISSCISSDIITQICDVIFESGMQYSQRKRLNISMMFECYGGKLFFKFN